LGELGGVKWRIELTTQALKSDGELEAAEGRVEAAVTDGKHGMAELGEGRGRLNRENLTMRRLMRKKK